MGIIERGNWTDYEWLVVLGAIGAFYMAWGIGANDVANAFATSVGAKTIKLWQACIIAGIFEFAGAIGLGGEVSRTIAGSIVSPSYFYEYPEIFAYGMLCALLVAGTWLLWATYYCLAVSTTHSIVGAVLGFGLVYGGADAVVWNEKTDEFPYRKGFVTIIMSWFCAPIGTGLLSALIFWLNRTCILRRENSTEKAFWSFPILVYTTVHINFFFILYKGASKELDWDKNKAGWVSACIAAGAAVAVIPLVFWLRMRHTAHFDAQDAAAAAAAADPEGHAKKLEQEAAEKAAKMEADAEAGAKSIFARMKNQLIKGLTYDVHEDVDKDDFVHAMHINCEMFSPRTEGVYKYLQVFSACCVAFAHGANDVANAVGPFTAIWMVYTTYAVSSSASMPRWILVLGAAGLVTGLATYGYNIIKVIGVNLASMTPSRGFSAELATGLMISLASAFGIPVSTTQMIVGAEMGVGCVDNVRGGANWKLFFKTFLGWVATIIMAAAGSAALFAFGIYAPSKTMSNYLSDYENFIKSTTNSSIIAMNQTNLLMNSTIAPGRFNKALDSELKGLGTNLSSLFNFKKNGHLSRYDLIEVAGNVSRLYTANSEVVVGYRKNSTARTADAITISA